MEQDYDIGIANELGRDARLQAIRDSKVCEADHAGLEVLSACCGAPESYGFCAKCHEHATWVRYCDVCEREFEAEQPTP